MTDPTEQEIEEALEYTTAHAEGSNALKSSKILASAYKREKALRAEMARNNTDLRFNMLEWKERAEKAESQVKSLEIRCSKAEAALKEAMFKCDHEHALSMNAALSDSPMNMYLAELKAERDRLQKEFTRLKEDID